MGDEEQWWHVYGGIIPGMAVDAWGTITVGPADRGPEVAATLTFDLMRGATARYLGSFGHEPSDAEKDALMPEGFG